MKNILTKVLHLIKRHKFFTVLLCFIMIGFCLSPFIAFNWPDNKIGENCFSIAFDKFQMNSVDKIVIQTPIKETTIADKSLVKKIVKSTMIADSKGYNVAYGGYFWRLFDGEKLVREMRQSTNYPTIIEVYKTDRAHWCFPSETDVGTVNISTELLKEMREVLEADGNSYGFLY